MKNVFTKSLIFLVSTAFLFTGCSTEDESVESSENRESQTGIFLDSPVEGLYYQSETFDGYTNAQGEFIYVEDELITFYVGDIEIGAALGQEEITPLSIASTPNATLETQEVKNIAAFLQTLDRDGNPENGIKIEPVIVEALALDAVDFSESVTELIGEMVNLVNKETAISLNPVYPEEAAVHLASSLNTTYEPKVLLFTDFIPTIESWNIYARPYTPSTATIWVHKTDEQGRPTQSVQYEKHPYRISRIYNYSDIIITSYQKTWK